MDWKETDTLWRNANCRRLSGLQPWYCKDLGLFGAFSFDITQANTTLQMAPVTAGNRLNPSTANPSPDGNQYPGRRISLFYARFLYLSDSAYSRMSGYTVKPPTGAAMSRHNLLIILICSTVSVVGTNKHLSAAWKLRYDIFQCHRQSYWNTSRSDQQISFGLNGRLVILRLR